MVWEAIFLLVVLKIPIVYLCLVVWWAIRAEPRPEEGAQLLARVSPTHGGSCDWHARRTARSRGPRPRTGGPARAAYARAGQARAEAAR
jgi:hypothetical protein